MKLGVRTSENNLGKQESIYDKVDDAAKGSVQEIRYSLKMRSVGERSDVPPQMDDYSVNAVTVTAVCSMGVLVFLFFFLIVSLRELREQRQRLSELHSTPEKSTSTDSTTPSSGPKDLVKVPRSVSHPVDLRNLTGRPARPVSVAWIPVPPEYFKHGSALWPVVQSIVEHRMSTVDGYCEYTGNGLHKFPRSHSARFYDSRSGAKPVVQNEEFTGACNSGSSDNDAEVPDQTVQTGM
ncbi:unnamed protein product [Echinostoma caproni]|uniref:Neuroligin-3-like n=1 Tax=Echinostoma caproni TaxID=27848 RepID=A0A183AJQ2_9TREM|nr:unnamed protein product [Echinostoma caproni]